MRTLLLWLIVSSTLVAADFVPDPKTVQRYGPAYRYPQNGWIVLHIEGKPYDRGFQHGTLMATEIAAYVRCYAVQQEPKNPSSGWATTRRLANALFLRKFDREYLEEMQGIADGAAAAGATFDDRKLDLIDIVALNVWAEIDSLDSALDALPTGLEGVKFPKEQPKAKPAEKSEHCSAFVATGPATADGKIVIGHITMFGLYPARFYNVWLDIKPEKGQRVLMQSYPGGIQSGMDYYMNDAGLVVCETTISQTRFNGDGTPLTNRIRKALQYGTSIDDVVKILADGNNGLYANEWLIADTKTNEIAMFELGTKKSKLWRSSKGEWYGGTEGFYWGCNNTKDLDVRLETLPSLAERPQATAWSPSRRDKKWLQYYAEHKGKITAETGKLAFSLPPICARSSLDAKVTSTALAKDLKTLAVFGPPIGGTWYPKPEQVAEAPEIVPLVPNDWTTLHPTAPTSKHTGTVVDMSAKALPYLAFNDRLPSLNRETKPAWRGTLLPASADDLWLTEGVAVYERMVALEQALIAENGDKHNADVKERLALEFGLHWSHYANGKDIQPAKDPSGDIQRDLWLRAQTARGIAALDLLRAKWGDAAFCKLMEDFSTANIGKPVTTAQFRTFLQSATPRKQQWLPETIPVPSGPRFTVKSWHDDLDHVVIVYGTLADKTANRDTAYLVQHAIQRGGSNYIVPVLSDDEALKKVPSAHVLLIGRPSTNKLAAEWAKAFPVTFDAAAFQVTSDTFAHAGSAVIVAGTHPKEARYSAVLIAGLSAEATQFAPDVLFKMDVRGANVVTIPHLAKVRPLWLN